MKPLILLLSACALAQQPAMPPFAMDWRQTSHSASDVSFLLDAPAGKKGFITIRDGHLASPDGRRFRIWGVNITGAGNLPSHENAPVVAAHLARFGIDCVRMHMLDRPAPTGLIDSSRDDTRALDLKQLDRLDFFVAELKKRGIYSDLNLNVARAYKPADGVRDPELLGFAKALTYFDERLLVLQREYAKQLLTHFNPYTKAEYRSEPAVLLVELVNENSIVESWAADRLQGKNTRKNPGTWADIPAGYEEQLTAMYRAWLDKQGLPPEPRLRKQEIAGAPLDRYRRELKFYMEIENRYFQGMRAFLKDELGVKSLLLATSDHNHSLSGYPLLNSAARLDVVDGHIYWQHPKYFEDADGKRTRFEILNSPMVDDPLHSTVVDLSRSAFAGKPYTVSEVNHPFPSEYSAEGIPILTAYAALQDWDGLFWYTFEHLDPAQWNKHASSYFELRPDPVKMAEIAAGALMFLRADVSPAKETVARSYSADQVLDSLRLPSAEKPYFTPGFPLSLPLIHGSRIATLDGSPTAQWQKLPEALLSDTGELAWQKGLVTVDTARSQALIGFNQANPKALRNLSAEVRNRFSAIVLSSLDGRPIATSRRMLLVTGSVVANTGQQWNEKRNSLVSWGTIPTVTEPVSGRITLRNLDGNSKVEVTALDGAGRPLGGAKPAHRTPAGWELEIGDPVTTWYRIVR